MINTVIAGDYKDKYVGLSPRNKPRIYWGINTKEVLIDKENVSRYEVAGQQSKTGFSTGKAVLGTIAFGGIGAIAGAGGKNKSSYQIELYFRNGKRSLIEVDERLYKAIMTELFGVEDYAPEQGKKKKRGHGCLISIAVCIGLFIALCVFLWSAGYIVRTK